MEDKSIDLNLCILRRQKRGVNSQNYWTCTSAVAVAGAQPTARHPRSACIVSAAAVGRRSRSDSSCWLDGLPKHHHPLHRLLHRRQYRLPHPYSRHRRSDAGWPSARPSSLPPSCCWLPKTFSQHYRHHHHPQLGKVHGCRCCYSETQKIILNLIYITSIH